MPQLLSRVSPAIVKVNRGDRWGTGTIFGDSTHVLTSFTLVNGAGEPGVFLADGERVSASVVAWSREDGIALLKLKHAVKSAPLPVAASLPSAGDAFLMPYHPRDVSLDEEEPGEAQVPMPLFGRVGRVGNTEIDLDAKDAALPGLLGAPVLAADGTLLGVLAAERSKEQRRAIARRIDRAQALYDSRDKMGPFDPDTDGGVFGGIFGVWGPELGAGFGGEVGYRLSWFRMGLTGVTMRSGYRPISGRQFRSLSRGMYEAQGVAQIELRERVFLLVGPAVAFTFDTITRRSHAPDGSLLETVERKNRLRPSLVLGLLDGPWLLRAIGSPYPEAEGRLDLGFSLGE